MPNNLWDNNEIQFARLLCEIVAACELPELQTVTDAMDLGKKDLDALFERANDVWEASKLRQQTHQLLWEYVETDKCVCEDTEDWTCLFCMAHKHLNDLGNAITLG